MRANVTLKIHCRKKFKMKTSGVFHISDHLQLTIKSLHVLFPSISLLKKHSTLKLQKQSVSILQHFRCLNTKKVKIKKVQTQKFPPQFRVLFSNEI